MSDLSAVTTRDLLNELFLRDKLKEITTDLHYSYPYQLLQEDTSLTEHLFRKGLYSLADKLESMNIVERKVLRSSSDQYTDRTTVRRRMFVSVSPSELKKMPMREMRVDQRDIMRSYDGLKDPTEPINMQAESFYNY